MADLVRIDSGQTLSVFQTPGEDIRVPTTNSDSIFTFGSFRLQKSNESDSLSADTRHLSFNTFATMETLNVGEEDLKLNFSVDNRELKLKKTDPLSYAYFSSFFTSVAQSINDINDNYPYAILSFDNNSGITIFDHAIEKVGSSFETTFKVPYSSSTNQGEVVINFGSPDKINLANDTDKFAIQLSGTSNDEIKGIVDYNFIPSTVSAGTSFMSFRISGTLFGSEETGTTFTDAIYIRPTRERLNVYLKELSRIQKQILIEGEFLIPSTEEPDIDILQEFIWPRTIDGFNPDNIGDEFNAFLSKILNASKLVDENKTGIMLRTMVPENFLEQDNEEADYRKLIETYSKQFDDLKQFIDSIAFAHTINYQEEESLPNKFLHKLSNLLGWKLSESFSETDLFEYLVGDVEEDNSLASVNVEIWKRILINIIWLFKKKGTRDALQFIFKLIGAPDCLINLNEFVYDIKKVAVPESQIEGSEFSPNEGQTDFVTITDSLIAGGPKKINENGYINYNSSIYEFQEGGPGRGNGQDYIDQWRPEFDPLKRVDNLKVQTGSTEFYGTQNIINSKELNVSISPADAIECDVLGWLKSTGTCWVWGTTGDTFAFSALTVPFELLYDCKSIDQDLIANMDFSQFAEYIYSISIDPRSRKTVDKSHTSFWYQKLKNIYLTYYYSNSPRSNRLTFGSLEFFISLLEVQFQDYFEQLIPATSIFQGTGTEYRNTIFNRQKFVYKEGINRGSEFQNEFTPPINPQLNPVKLASIPVGNIPAEMNVFEVKASLSANVGMNLKPIKAISSIPQAIKSNLNPVSITAVIQSNTSSDQQDFGPFDFAVIRYKWDSDGGSDLDTRTAIVNTGNVTIDGDNVGWNEGSNTVGPLVGTDPFLTWGGDNLLSGAEAVLIDFKKLTEDFPAENTFEIRLRSFFQSINSGVITLEMETYMGGVMINSGTDFINPEGILIDKKTLSTTITTNDSFNGDDVGKILFDVSTKVGQLLEV